MKHLKVTNQQELDIAINESVHEEILLDGDYFTLPTSDKIHALTFVGENPQTIVFLTGTRNKSNKYDPKEHRISDYEPQMVSQFDTVFSAKCKNLTITSEQKIELYFQTEEELQQWEDVTFDNKKIDIVIFVDEMDSAQSKDKAEDIEEGLKEISEMTVEFLEDVQESFTDLIKVFK
jgi:hypothetical protein